MEYKSFFYFVFLIFLFEIVILLREENWRLDLINGLGSFLRLVQWTSIFTLHIFSGYSAYPASEKSQYIFHTCNQLKL